MKQRLITYASAALVVAICGFIFYMSAKSAVDSSALSMGVVYHIITYIVPGYDQMGLAQQLHWQDVLETPVRKIAHFTEFAVLGIAMLNALFQAVKLRRGAASLSPKLMGAAWVLTTLYAASDEIHQLFVPGRACMFADVCIDALGVAFGILVVFGIARLWRKKRR